MHFPTDKTQIKYYILTRFKLDLTAKEIHGELTVAWGEGYVSYSTVADWVHRFKQGRTSLEDDPRIGRPVTAIINRNIENVRMLIEENPHINNGYIAFELGLSYGTISGIIHDELKMKKFWLFGHLKRQLGTYSDSKCLQRAVTKELRGIPEDEYRKTFKKWIDRMKLCISNQGEYFEHLM